MPYLARVLAQPNAWADFSAAGLQPETCSLASLLAVLSDVGAQKGSGTSYWEVDPFTPASVRRVVAAYVGLQKTLDAVHMKYVATELLAAQGVAFRKTRSPTPDKELGNAAHYDIQVTGIAQAVSIAKAMAPTQLVLGQKEVEECMTEGLLAQRFTAKDLKTDVVHHLAKAGRLSPVRA